MRGWRCHMDAIEPAPVKLCEDGGAVVHIKYRSPAPMIGADDVTRSWSWNLYWCLYILADACCKDSLKLLRHSISSLKYTPICFETSHAVTRRHAGTDSLGLETRHSLALQVSYSLNRNRSSMLPLVWFSCLVSLITWRRFYVTPLLRELHCLSFPERINYKLALLVFKCLNGLAPLYLACEFHPVCYVPLKFLDSTSR